MKKYLLIWITAVILIASVTGYALATHPTAPFNIVNALMNL